MLLPVIIIMAETLLGIYLLLCGKFPFYHAAARLTVRTAGCSSTMPPTNGEVIKVWADSDSASSLIKNLSAKFPEFKWESCDKFVLNTKINRLKKKQTLLKQNHKSKQLDAFKNATFELPQKSNPNEDEYRENISTENIVKIKQEISKIQRKTVEIVSENRSLKRDIGSIENDNEILVTQVQHSERKIEILQNLLEIANNKYKDICSFKQESYKLKEQLQEWEDKYDSLSAEYEKTVEELHEKKQKLQKQSTRNLNKKLKRRDHTIEEKGKMIAERERELGEKEREIESVREENEIIACKVTDLQRERKNLLQKVCRLKKKPNSYTDVFESNLLQIENLKLQVSEKDQQIRDLEQINTLLTEPFIDTFYDGKFTNELRETVMTLVTECGVSQNKVNEVMSVVVKKLTGKTLSRLPSTGVKSRLLLEAKRVANQQVAKELLSTGNTFTLHQDGTSKFHRHFQSFQLTSSTGVQFSAGLLEVGSGDATCLFETFKDLISDLAEAINCDDKRKNIAKIAASIISTMSDQGSVNHVFNDKFKVFREDLLPLVFSGWDQFSLEEKHELGKLFSFFCKMHIFVNMATETDKCLTQFERTIVSEGRNPYAFSNNESGISRLIRTVSKAFSGHGCEKSGVGGHFATYLADKDIKNQLITFRGHRFNHLYHAAAVTYYHFSDIQDFLSLWSEPNELLKSISFDIHESVYKAGIRALGLIDKVVTGPFWRLIETVPNALSLNTHLHQLKIHLEAWSKDASPMLAGENVFSEEHVQIKKDCVYESLIAPSEDPVFESYTQMALELCFAGMLLVLERQAKDQLPGGRYWNLDEHVCSKLSEVPTTNTVSERDFAQLDMLMRSKPSAAVTTFEAIIMWSNNKTSEWLNSLSPEEHAQVINEARVSTPEFQKSIKEKQQQLYQKKLEVLKKKQEKKAKQEEKQHSNKVRLTQKITEIGGLWTNIEELERYKNGTDKGKFKEAVLIQLQFRRVVLNSKGQKYFFQQQHKGQQYSLDQLEDNLKQVIILNLDEEAVNQPELKLIYRAVDDVQNELGTVKLSLHKRIEENRQKIIICQQKELLPMFNEQPDTLIGKTFKHKCRDPESGVVEWYRGIVTGIKKQNVTASKTEYFVKYDDDDDEWFFPILKDMEKGDLILL